MKSVELLLECLKKFPQGDSMRFEIIFNLIFWRNSSQLKKIISEHLYVDTLEYNLISSYLNNDLKQFKDSLTNEDINILSCCDEGNLILGNKCPHAKAYETIKHKIPFVEEYSDCYRDMVVLINNHYGACSVVEKYLKFLLDQNPKECSVDKVAKMFSNYENIPRMIQEFITKNCFNMNNLHLDSDLQNSLLHKHYIETEESRPFFILPKLLNPNPVYNLLINGDKPGTFNQKQDIYNATIQALEKHLITVDEAETILGGDVGFYSLHSI